SNACTRSTPLYPGSLWPVTGKQALPTSKTAHTGLFQISNAGFGEYEPIWKGKRILGAMAYLKTDESVQTHAQRQGLFVIRATGSSASIINSTDFRPKAFY
ncbi:MAG: hypothetical protein OXD47_09340, partial [Gammaproteobacteria bacterium]|nr:hypothetical protein [Gammaproteobacteria bacterium]